ncbi:MAG: lipopolysaccharide assembly protein LapA domain-containing protein [Alphaproteobacteria bacterium]
MGFIKTILGFILAIAITAFAVQNRAPINIQFSPLHDPFPLPLYAIALGGLLLGFILGGTLVWLNDGKIRHEKRRQKKQIKTLEKDLATLKSPKPQTAPASDLFPALPKK